jgi:hypothetical protein
MAFGYVPATKADKESTRSLLHTINKALETKALPDSRLDEIFEVWWPKLEEKLLALPKPRTETKPQRTERALLVELLNLSRNQMATSQDVAIRLSNLVAKNRCGGAALSARAAGQFSAQTGQYFRLARL